MRRYRPREQLACDRAYLSWGLGALVAAAILTVLGNTNLKPGANGGTGPLLVICAALAALMFLKLCARRDRPGARRSDSRTGRPC
jgi:hypothetical protein